MKTISWKILIEFEEFNRGIFEKLSYVGKLISRVEKGNNVKLTYVFLGE